MRKSYKTICDVVGPLMLVTDVKDVKYNELVEIEQQNGEIRFGKVLEVSGNNAVVQLFSSSENLEISTAKAKFLGHSLELAVSADMLGRVFNGMGKILDNGAPFLASKRMDVNGTPINPTARDYPNEFIQTGISSIDGLNTLVRGQKLPIFSMAGLPHAQLAAQIARQATVFSNSEKTDDKDTEPKDVASSNFAIVFAAIGITHEEADFFIQEFSKSGSLEHSVLFVNLANDPALERIAAPRMALTCAEYLAFELGMHVLVIMTDMTNYAEAMREISAARKEVPGRRGYPGYLYTDLASLYERAGRIRGNEGSITQIPILTMPEDDKTHPIPDLTGYITEGQMILSRDLAKKGINPPIDVLPSLSRLKDKGIGDGKTRADHSDTMNQLFSAYAKGKDSKELASILGESALGPVDKLYARFAEEFERRYLNQGFDKNRSIYETLDLGWQLLRMLPREELKRIRETYLNEHYTTKDEK